MFGKFLFFSFFLVRGDRLTSQSMGKYKMFDILKTAGRRAKPTKIWASGVSYLLVYTGYVLLLSVQSQSEGIGCISDFRQPSLYLENVGA